MTGLDFKNDRILEIAVIITNGNLDVVDPEGLSYIIKTEKDVLDAMHPWCVKQHGEVSRLLCRCPSTISQLLASMYPYHLSLV